SSAGMTGAAKGTCDIGMASRDLKDSEKEALTATAIALDGIVIIVNPANELNEITSENIKKIFKGDITTWGEING
ncbi:MAG: substrate-binding domain-containing protein, partial [Oscillospiraceae bacterium]